MLHQCTKDHDAIYDNGLRIHCNVYFDKTVLI